MSIHYCTKTIYNFTDFAILAQKTATDSSAAVMTYCY